MRVGGSSGDIGTCNWGIYDEDNSAVRMTIAANGQVLIADALQAAATPGLAIGGGDNATGLFLANTDTLGVAVGGAERVRFCCDGRVGIGTASPTVGYLVESAGSILIESTSPELHINDTSGGTPCLKFMDNGTVRGMIGTSSTTMQIDADSDIYMNCLLYTSDAADE